VHVHREQARVVAGQLDLQASRPLRPDRVDSGRPDRAAVGDHRAVEQHPVRPDPLTGHQLLLQPQVIERGDLRQLRDDQVCRVVVEAGRHRSAEAAVHLRPERPDDRRIGRVDPALAVGRDVEQQVGAEPDRTVVDREQVLDGLRLVVLGPEPPAAYRDVALGRQVERLGQVTGHHGVVAELGSADHVVDRLGGETVLIADPADGGAAHVEHHRPRLVRVDHVHDRRPVVGVPLRPGPVEPQLGELAVPGAQLGQLGPVEP